LRQVAHPVNSRSFYCWIFVTALGAAARGAVPA
jgi:hypothetical protein